jgi:ATP-binding cassette subfamily B protein
MEMPSDPSLPSDHHGNESADPAAIEGEDGAALARPALDCLVSVARHYGINTTTERLSLDHALPGRDMTSLEVVRLAQSLGLKARSTCLTWQQLVEMGDVFPAIVRIDGERPVVVVGVRRDENATTVVVADPLASRRMPQFLSPEEFARRWQGEIILLRRVYATAAADQPFGLRWFIPELWRQRAAFRDVAVAAFVLHFIALVSPLFFQIVIDKVLSHNSYSTLYVLTIGVVVIYLFEAAFNFLRSYLLLLATNKIDIRLSTRTFAHLLNLPITYFEQATAGVTVRHMQQVEKIRQFLTGRLFLTALDGTALFVFVPVLALYSVHLTLVVLAFTAIMGLVIIGMIRPFRRRLLALYAAEADRQAMLVETIHGMRTVKSSAIEPVRRRQWDQSAAAAIGMQFRVGQMSIGAQTVIGLVEKVMPVAVIGLGTFEVIDHTLSVGALVAFQMLSSKVVAPLVQIVSLVQSYQEAALSVGMLGKVMNTRAERPADASGLSPAITGNVEFEQVCFRYRPDGPPVLADVNLRIPAGAVVGVVGRSGSGKTTLTRLIQGLYPLQEGVIRLDGIDIREIDLAHLRRSIGVVLQDNFLFRGTVRDNIAITRPSSTLEEIASVARLAGADEFIERLPQGFDTWLEESAANLSGGQRQRLAIARALLMEPRLLILDEATSALDPDSEAIFMTNLAGIASGRTVLIVSHRLSTLVKCDAIVVFDQGRIIDGGSHSDLLKRCPIYTHLWNQQNQYQ